MIVPVLADRGGVDRVGGEQVLDQLPGQGREGGVGRKSLHGYPHRERVRVPRAITRRDRDGRTAGLSGGWRTGSSAACPGGAIQVRLFSSVLAFQTRTRAGGRK